MANKYIIPTPTPSPSNRIIGGSSQRSAAQARLQGSHGWRYNHRPVDANEAQNATFWQSEASRFDAPLSSSGDILYSRQGVQRSVLRDLDRERLVNTQLNLERIYHGGDNQTLNKSPRIRDLTFGSFESELDITDETVPGIKKRISFQAIKGGVDYNGEQITPFSVFSSSVDSGYRAAVIAAGYTNVEFTNFHQDNILTYGKDTPIQGPFTERHVGGIQARHNAALRTINRKEEYDLELTTAQGASIVLTVAEGVATEDLDGTDIDFAIGGVSYLANFDETKTLAQTTKSIIGISDAIDEDDVATAIKESMDDAILADGLPLVVSVVVGASNKLNIVGTYLGTRDNGTEFAGDSLDHGISTTAPFSGGAVQGASITTIHTGDTPKGQYLRGAGPKAPVNIRNIQTVTSSANTSGVAVVGNYIKNYEIVQGNNRAATNMDFAFNTENYSYSAPSAFLTTPAMRALGRTGSADYPAPRQIPTRRTNQTIIVGTFAAPGSKQDSKQLFRDVNSNQFSPNNALPFRNMVVRAPYNKDLSDHITLDGMLSSDPTRAALIKTPANRTQRVEISGTFGSETYVTGNVYDNAFVSRPIPAGDSTQWFMSLSGSNTLTYTDYVLSGSRYPKDISITMASIQAPVAEVSPAFASGYVSFGTYNSASFNSTDIVLIDNATVPNTVQFITDATQVLNWAGRVSAAKWYYGTKNASSLSDVRLSFGTALMDAQAMGDIEIMPGIGADGYIQLLQDNIGAGGNTIITGSTIGIGAAFTEDFTGGVDYSPASGIDLGTGGYTYLGTDYNYLWSQTPYSSPWVQTRLHDRNEAAYYRKNNVYEILPVSKEVESTGIDVTRRQVLSTTLSRSVTDQAANVRKFYYSKSYIEPPLTSRYKPLTHQVQTFTGSPSETGDNKITLNLKYSYGNTLMGFANRGLNKDLCGDIKFLQGKVKLPYEALREQASSALSRTVNAIEQIKMFSYGETIYPKEIYTFLSGTRARLSYQNDFWRDDILTDYSLSGVLLSYAYLRLNQSYFIDIAREQNRNFNRIESPFVTSQGTEVSAAVQFPYDQDSPYDKEASWSGSGSIWPLDSYLWSDAYALYAAYLTGTYSTPVILADMTTLPAGELMMVNYGPVQDKNTNLENAALNTLKSSYTLISTASVNTAQYVYTAPFVTGTYAGSYQPEPRSPGNVYSLPPWYAGLFRYHVDGEQKGAFYEPAFPFYDSYDSYVEGVRLIGKDYTIVPEFRISNHIEEYENNDSMFTVISSSLEISGANSHNYNGTNTDFYTRYATTDTMEFMDDFMSFDKGDKDYIFNKFPRHLEVGSDAILKLLPYEGFYPMNRSLQLATLYSQSYGPAAQYEGTHEDYPLRWRALMRPFFAPGILYNSIKSGIAVDYPIRRPDRNMTEYSASDNLNTTKYPDGQLEIGYPLYGCLTSSLINNPSGTYPNNSRRVRTTSSWEDPDVNSLFWADRLPFESILAPENYLTQIDTAGVSFGLISGSQGTVLSDSNLYLRADVTASFRSGAVSGTLYQKAISNFLANVPEFFLKTKENKYGSPGKMTKFVSQFGTPPKGTQESAKISRTVQVSSSAVYMMEIGLLKTDQFNMYSNPSAFGQPTNVGNDNYNWSYTAQAATGLWAPSGTAWPTHRGEFAPFTPPYYYGPSVVRITFMPTGDKTEYTLDEIINNDRSEIFVDYINESGSYYDVQSGSFYTEYGTLLSTSLTPYYDWNRAWVNRMDIDASVFIGNEFGLGNGGTYRSTDPNKWTIMPKWESPILDFPASRGSAPSYDFSSSVAPGSFTEMAQGMWHQYGTMPNKDQGIYLYIKDIPTGKNEEYDLVSTMHPAQPGGMFATYPYGLTTKVRKIPPYVVDSGRTVESLADLVGFDSDEIIRKGFNPTKAKRLGELADNEEQSISEALLALPFYINEQGTPTLITLQAPANELGPKIKEFRKKFTKYSLPPVLAKKLLGLVPRGYPRVPDLINPFGEDEYDSILSSSDIKSIPVIYLMEHKVNLSRQDLADMWQGIMPDIGRNLKFSLSAIDHYMPGDNVEDSITQFPEVLKAQINLGATRTGHPRYDLLDIAESCKQGFTPEIRWMVFKVKERGVSSYAEMIMQEVDGPDALGYDNIKELIKLNGLPKAQVDKVLGDRDEFSKNVYISKHGLDNPTYNWPYDYCSLIETAKINTKVGFRPDLDKEYAEAEGSSDKAGKDIVSAIDTLVKNAVNLDKK